MEKKNLLSLEPTIDLDYKNAVYNTFISLFNKIDLKTNEYRPLLKKLNFSGNNRITNAQLNKVVLEIYMELESILKENNVEISEILENISKLYLKYTQKRDEEEVKENIVKKKISLPGNNYTVGEFVKDVAPVFKDNQQIFFKANENKLVEIKEHYSIINKKNINGFFELDSKRFFSIFEELVDTFKMDIDRENNRFREVKKSVSEQTLKLMLENDTFIKELSVVNRFFNYPILFIHDNQLLFSKSGYDGRLQAFFTQECPEINLMGVNKAKEIIFDILSEFCFKEEIDKVMAISYLITPGCRGLYQRLTCRTPLFLIMANRERAGKDYFASLIGTIYEGQAKENTAISNGDGKQNNEELRKKITSSLMVGQRLFHSANNKGLINNAVFEGVITAEFVEDRILGKNEIINLPNEMDFSLSGNMGLTYSADLWQRSRSINLFFAEEDPNKRVFKRPDLRGYVLENRGLILSAIYSLIQDWYDNGSPSNNEPFTSFPEWARVVGGVMVHHGLGDPCTLLKSDVVGGDKETQDFKRLFELYYQLNGQKLFTVANIKSFISEHQEEEGFFLYFDFANKLGDSAKFGLKFPKYIGREFSGVKLVLAEDNSKSSRKKYKLTHFAEKSGRVGSFGSVKTSFLGQHPEKLQQCLNPSILNNPTTLEAPMETEVAEPSKSTQEIVIDYLKDEKEAISFEDLSSYLNGKGINEEYIDPIISGMLKAGSIFEPRKGYYKILE